MATIFGTGQVGKVKRLESSASRGTIGLCSVQGVGEAGGNEALQFTQHSCIVSGIGFRSGVNAQFQHTIGNVIYLYVFGDRVGDVQIKGLAFNQKHEGAEDVSGLEKAFEFYRRSNATNNTEPVTVVVGKNLYLRGYLLEFSAEASDTETRVSPFTLTMNLTNNSAG